MRVTRREFGMGLAGTAAAVAGPAAAQDAELTRFLDAEYEALLQTNPEDLTRLGRKDQYDRLSDTSDAGVDRVLAMRQASVTRMKARFDRARLGPDAQVSYDLWALEGEREAAQRKWRSHRYVFDRGGPHTRLPNFLINAHRVDEAADMEAYIARLSAMGPVLDVELGRAKAAATMGVRMPRFAYDQTLAEIARLTAGAPFTGKGDAALYADVQAKLRRLRDNGKIDDARAGRLLAAAAAAMGGSVKPAYDRISAWLVEDRGASAADPQGAGALPDGQAYYAAQLRDETTTDMTAEEIHQLGLREVARIRGEMETLKAKIGFKGSLGEFFVFMRTDKQFYLPNDDEGREKYLRAADGYLSAMEAKLPQYFARLPKSDLVVKRVEAFREEPGGAAHYAAGSLDAGRPGVFYVHLADTGATPTYELEGTAYHEGWPGHHMQISLAQEMKGTPRFRGQSGYGAYIEGWGLYSELFAKEIGFYQDPYSDFGRLGREIWRGIRLVVDTGIHAKGWSEAQAYEYYTSNSPQPVAKIRSEIRRYIVTPGQATSYKVGMVRILALREEAKDKLGSRFDIKGFHEAVLGAGALPLSVLDARVRAWVASRANPRGR